MQYTTVLPLGGKGWGIGWYSFSIMNNSFFEPPALLHFSFWWSEVRLIVAAITLFVGASPLIYIVLPIPFLYGIIGLLLKLAWIISGLTATYLGYRWYIGGEKLFGGVDLYDRLAFAVMVISGLNLGIAGILNINIGMSISTNYILFVLMGVAYLWSAYRLYSRRSIGPFIS